MVAVVQAVLHKELAVQAVEETADITPLEFQELLILDQVVAEALTVVSVQAVQV